MVIQPRVLLEQTDHRTHQAQRTASSTARRDPTPPDSGLRTSTPQQTTRPRHHDQQRDGHPGQQPRPRGALLEPGLGQTPPPLRSTKARLTPGPAGLCRHRLRRRRGPMGDHIPAPPLAMPLPLPPPRDPQWLGVPGTIEPMPERATTGRARTAQRVALPPPPCHRDLGALLDAAHARHLQLRQQRAQGAISDTTVRRHAAPAAPHLPDDTRHRPAHHRECRALHPTVEPRRVRGPPLERPGAPARDERHPQQGRLPFDRPSDRQPDGAMGGAWDERVPEHRIGQVPRCQARVVPQARQPLRRSFLLAKAAGPWGLTAGLLVTKGLHNVPNGFALMAMGPRQHLLDRRVETSSRSVLCFHIPRLA